VLDDAVQYATTAIRVAGTIALLITAIGFRRWTLLILAAFCGVHTGIYVALLAGAHLGTWAVTFGGVAATGIVVSCVAAALASGGNLERLRALLADRGAPDPHDRRWGL
jgi:hypothetical protein